MKIICIGQNYQPQKNPIIFIKPDTALLKGSDFYLPEFSNEILCEAEIVIKISKGGKYIQKENAHKHYEQIGLGLDLMANDIQNELKANGLPWEIAKGFDGSAVVSNFYPKENFNLENIQFHLKQNNTEIQNGASENIFWNFDEIIANVSQYFTLRVGDLIFTGSPTSAFKINENDILTAFLENEKVIDIRVL